MSSKEATVSPTPQPQFPSHPAGTRAPPQVPRGLGEESGQDAAVLTTPICGFGKEPNRSVRARTPVAD